MSEHKLKRLQTLLQSKDLPFFDLVQDPFKKEYLEDGVKKYFLWIT